LRPDYLFARFNQGSTLLGLGRFDEALANFEATLAIAPNHADTLCHRGNVLLKLNRVDEAFASYAQALSLAPDHPQILQNHTVALRHLGRPREALATADKALRIKPDYAAARFEQAIALLALGDFERGWAAYESRWLLAEFEPQRRHYGGPHWLGKEDVAGKTVLLHCEQGFGDTLQFVRYAPLLAQRGATVIVEVQEHLKALLSQMPSVSAVLARGEPLPPFDLYCPLLSLPLAFGTRLETIPANVPYIAADPGLVAQWAAKLSDFAGKTESKTKIGLVWAGNSSANAIDTRRSLRLREFAPLAAIPGIHFFSLQKGEPSAQALHPPEGMTLTDYSAELHGFEDTAALIANLDLVISVDTSVAHLAGAMAKPVFILSRFDGCWRWLNHRDDSPWYPTARLFHQKAPGAWDEVIVRLRQALKG